LKRLLRQQADFASFGSLSDVCLGELIVFFFGEDIDAAMVDRVHHTCHGRGVKSQDDHGQIIVQLEIPNAEDMDSGKPSKSV
jgi:hypothetical protein